MAIRAPLLPLQIFENSLKFQIHPSPTIPFPLFHHPTPKRKLPHLCCKNSSISDADLASELAPQMAKFKVPSIQRKEAMKKSRELLFADLCQYLGLGAEELKKKWREMGEEERLECARGFVADWSLAFHPLSLRSVKEMVEEHLAEEKNPPPVSSPFITFPDFESFFRFSKEKLRKL